MRRRFSEFVLLRELLLKTYQGLYIPALPVDGVFSASGNALTGLAMDIESEFIRNRTTQLNFFAIQLSNIPFLLTSPVLRAFLSNTEDFKSLNFTVSSTSQGEILWKSFIESAPLENDSSRIIHDIKRQLGVLKSVLRQVQDECSLLSKQSIAFAKSLKATQEKLNSWNEAEKAIADPSKNDYPNRNSLMPSFLDASVDAFSFWSLTSQASFTKLKFVRTNAESQYCYRNKS